MDRVCRVKLFKLLAALLLFNLLWRLRDALHERRVASTTEALDQSSTTLAQTGSRTYEPYHAYLEEGESPRESVYQDNKNHRAYYESLFQDFPDHQNSSQWVVYSCESQCGGLGDRLKGIVQIYILSILSRRRFAIHWTDPCPIEHFMVPNKFDWTFDMDKLDAARRKRIQYLDYKEPHQRLRFEFETYDVDPASVLKSEIILIKGNQEWTDMYRQLSVSPSRFPHLFRYSNAELTRIIFYGLFHHTESLAHATETFFTKEVQGNRLVCFHARMGEKSHERYSLKAIMPVFDFLNKYSDPDNFKIMVASDKAEVKEIAKKRFSNIVDADGPIVHIDTVRKDRQFTNLKCDGFRRALVDHAILSNCDVLVLTNSGFGVSAAHLRHRLDGVHVFFNPHGVFPVHSDNLRQAFQYPCLGQANARGTLFYTGVCDG